MSKEAVIHAKATKSPDTSERDLARQIARGLPLVTLVASIGVGVVSSVGPAILILAAGTLLGSIAFFWASVRTMSGDAPLAEHLAEAPARRHTTGDAADRKLRVLRALKDLEHERAVGKIDAADYEELVGSYRAQATALMREMDAEIEPLRAKAEEMARKHLTKRGLLEGEVAEAADASEPARDRRACAACGTSNEADARFCKKCGANVAKETSDASA